MRNLGPHDMGSDAMTTDNKVVLFADILGFAALTESYPLDVDRCRVGDTDHLLTYLVRYLKHLATNWPTPSHGFIAH